MRKMLGGLAMMLFAISCAKTDEETELRNSTQNSGTPVVTCDTTNMKYAANVQPILQDNCYSCHANGISLGGVRLETYNQVLQRANSGQLIGVINHTSGYPAMPYRLPKMSDCNINKIRSWVNRGALNN